MERREGRARPRMYFSLSFSLAFFSLRLPFLADLGKRRKGSPTRKIVSSRKPSQMY